MKIIENLMDKCFKIDFKMSTVLKLTLAFLVITCVYFTIAGHWKSYFYYSEYDINILEKEANRIVTQKDFNTEYNLTITSYNNKTNSLSFELEDESSNYITVHVEDIKEEESDFSIKKQYKSKEKFIMVQVLIFIATSLILALLVHLVMMLGTTLIGFILLIIYILIYIVQLLILKIKHKNTSK